MMKALSRLATLCLAALAVTSSALAEPHKGWTADLEGALEQAKKENKAVLVEFTGSDWCPPCMMMRKNVFSKEEFVTKASEKFVLVELDFPNKDKELKEKNKPYAEKFKIDAFPTIVLLDAEGNEFSRFTASAHPEVEAFLEHINKQLDRKDLD